MLEPGDQKRLSGLNVAEERIREHVGHVGYSDD